MSAMLGPIHFWLYRKIQLQEGLIERILSRVTRQEGERFQKEEEAFLRKEEKGLEELIDPSNIHGWLQARIVDVETRYANLVANLLQRGRLQEEEIREVAYQFGVEHAVSKEATPAEVYKNFEDCLLNGMPCDRVNQILEQEADSFSWEERIDIHGAYWEEAGLDGRVYESIRLSMMQGMLVDTEYHLEKVEHQYHLHK